MTSHALSQYSIWDEANQSLEISKSLFENSSILAASITPDGKTIAALRRITDDDSATCQHSILSQERADSIFELPLGELRKELLSSMGMALSWSQNGEALVVYGSHAYEGPFGPGRIMVFSAVKNAIVADKRLNDLTTATSGYIDGLSSNGDTLFFRTYANPSSVLVLDTSNLTIKSVIDNCLRATCLPDGNVMCLTTEGKIETRSAANNAILSSSSAMFPKTNNCTFSEDGRYLLSQFPYSRLYNIRNERLMLTHYSDIYKTSHGGFKGTISANGHYRLDTVEDRQHICYVVEFDDGTQQMFDLNDFAEVFKWKNDSELTHMTLSE